MLSIGFVAALVFFGAIILIAIISNRHMEPDIKARATPKDFFLHLGIMATLYASAAALLTLLFQVINYAFPDNLNAYYYYGSYDPYSGPVRWAIATLVVVFPLLWFLSWILRKDFVANPEKRNMGLRKWLVYLTLFVAGAMIVIDLITLINTFLGGEITVRFVLKVLSVLVVAGLVFGYYVYDLRKGADVSKKTATMFLLVGAVLILGSIIAGFSVMGSPGRQRNLQFDSQKVGDLQNIQWQVVNYWQRKEALPATLADLRDPISSYSVPTDPQTGAAYEYRKTGDHSFELCAEFNYETDERLNSGDPTMGSRAYPYVEKNETWNHLAGRHCFERTIDPELYPPLDSYGRPIPTAGTAPAVMVPVASEPSNLR